MRTLRTIREVRAALWGAREAKQRVGLVPTMGAYHEGHLSLMRTARAECDVVVVSLYVNPTQFGADEDFGLYPRDEGADAQQVAELGIDFLFAPADEEMYPPGFSTSIDPGAVSTGLCGSGRPGHFSGVATIVARLFGIVAPDVAYFGTKDYQQVSVIRRIVHDLAIPVEIRALPTVRELDGLAYSSRNVYLRPEERERAPRLYGGLRAALDLYEDGERDGDTLAAAARDAIESSGLELEYLELRDAETLGYYTPEREAVVAAAVRAGSTRLIDNVVLTPPRVPAPLDARLRMRSLPR